MVALVHSSHVALGWSERKPHFDDASLESTADGEADIFEHGEHGSVVAHDLRDESLDPVSCGKVGELFEESDADASALIVVRYDERGLGNQWVAKANVVCDRDDPFVVELAHNGDERASLVQSGPMRVRASRVSATAKP